MKSVDNDSSNKCSSCATSVLVLLNMYSFTFFLRTIHFGTAFVCFPVRCRQSTCGYQKPHLENHQKPVKIAIGASNLDGQRTTCGSNPFSDKSVADYRKVIEYHGKHLELATETDGRVGPGRAYENLGDAHQSLSDYQKAIECHGKHLEIAIEIGDRFGQGRAYGNLGEAHQSLSDYQKA